MKPAIIKMENKIKKLLIYFINTIACLVIGFLLGLANDAKQSKNKAKAINNFTSSIDSLRRQVWLGDTLAYECLRGNYLDYPSEYFLFWAMYMANKFDYPQAYMDVYNCIIFTYKNDSAIFVMDSNMRTFALTYLTTAKGKNNKHAVEEIELLLTAGVPSSWLLEKEVKASR